MATLLLSNVTVNTGVNVIAYDSAVINVANIAGGDSIQISGSLDPTNYSVMMVTNLLTLTTANTITANGLYQVAAPGYLRFNKTGSGSTTTVSVLLKR